MSRVDRQQLRREIAALRTLIESRLEAAEELNAARFAAVHGRSVQLAGEQLVRWDGVPVIERLGEDGEGGKQQAAGAATRLANRTAWTGVSVKPICSASSGHGSVPRSRPGSGIARYSMRIWGTGSPLMAARGRR
jgi:hypothetical protein